MPVGFELNSNMHIFYTSANHIYSLHDHLCISYVADIILFPFYANSF